MGVEHIQYTSIQHRTTKLETIRESIKTNLNSQNKQNNQTLWIKVGMTSQVSQTEKNGVTQINLQNRAMEQQDYFPGLMHKLL